MIIPLNLKRGRTKESLKVDSSTLWVENEDMKDLKWRFQYCPLHKRIREGKEKRRETLVLQHPPQPHVPSSL